MNTKVENLDEQNPIIIAEYRLLNALCLDPSRVLEIDRETFIHETCKDTYDAIDKLHSSGISVTKNAVFQDASARNLNVTADFIQAVMNINSDPNVDIKDAVKMLDDAKQSMSALRNIEKVRKLINENPLRNDSVNNQIAGLLNEAQSSLAPVVKKQRIQDFTEVKEFYLSNFDHRKNGKQYSFGDPIMDKAVKYGPAPGGGGLIAAATGMGKSAWCLNLINRCLNTRIPLMYYSLEMGEIDTFDRMMALRSNVDIDTFVNPKDDEEWKMTRDLVEQQFKILEENQNFRFSESAMVTIPLIRQDILKFYQETGNDYCIVVFDLLSMVKDFMMTDKDGLNFAQGIEVAINKLNAMAKELNFHYIAVLQMNRKSEDGRITDLDDINQFRPMRTQIKNAGAFLERVRWAVGLFRPKYYAETYIPEKELWEDMTDYCEVLMLKQNNGATGLIGEYLFDPDTMTMTPVVDDNGDPYIPRADLKEEN